MYVSIVYHFIIARSLSYAISIKAKMVHALIESKKLKDLCNFTKNCYNVRVIELELVVAIINIKKYAKVHPTILMATKTLLEGYTCISTRFFFIYYYIINPS